MHIDFSTLPKWTNKRFYPLYFDKHRFVVMKGGAGSGKSYDAHQRAIFRMVAEPGHNYLVIRKVAASNSISTWPLMLMIINQWNLGGIFAVSVGNQTITNRINGNQMKFMGLDDIEKVKSITFINGPLTDILIEEATEITETDFNQLNLRLRGKNARRPFQMTMCFNPVSDTHWMKRRFFDNPGPKRKQITIHESTYLDNRFIDDEYRDELEALKYEDRVYYEIYALGNWGSVGNLVFRNFVIEPVRYSLEDFDAVYAGQDFGYNHYNAIELVGIKDGEKYSFRELYVRHMTNDEVIDENERKGVLEKTRECTADSAEPKSIKEWSKNGYNMRGARKGPDSVRQQIGWLNKGTWHIDPIECPGLASEVQSYKWKEDRDGNVLDEPVPFKDDAIAATRYAIEDLTEYRTSMLDVI
jgi:phage terminase large subunit